jgi:5-hydroxyisourate hydrolase
MNGGGITTHVLDTARGLPAAGVPVLLEKEVDGDWVAVGRGHTDADDRARGLSGGSDFTTGRYRLTFEVGVYQSEKGGRSFFPYAIVVFDVDEATLHSHVPLLLSPFGYSTYKGS